MSPDNDPSNLRSATCPSGGAARLLGPCLLHVLSNAEVRGRHRRCRIPCFVVQLEAGNMCSTSGTDNDERVAVMRTNVLYWAPLHSISSGHLTTGCLYP